MGHAWPNKGGFLSPARVEQSPYVAGYAQTHWISAQRLWDMICTSDTGREWDVIGYFLGSIAHWLVISPLHPQNSRQIACDSSRSYVYIDKAPCVKPGSIDPMALSPNIPGCTPISIAISMGTIDGCFWAMIFFCNPFWLGVQAVPDKAMYGETKNFVGAFFSVSEWGTRNQKPKFHPFSE